MVNKRWTYPLLLAGGLVLLAVGLVLGQGSGYSLDWWTVDGGGGALSGGSYELEGTAGQADAGALSGGAYELSGGFWTSVKYQVFLPAVMNNYRPCYAGPGEGEDNEVGSETGPLCFDQTYTGEPDNDTGANENDIFFVEWDGSGTLAVEVTDFSATGQVQLWTDGYGTLVEFQADQGSGTYQVECVGGTANCGGGRYYIVLFVPEDAKNTAPAQYELVVTVTP